MFFVTFLKQITYDWSSCFAATCRGLVSAWSLRGQRWRGGWRRSSAFHCKVNRHRQYIGQFHGCEYNLLNVLYRKISSCIYDQTSSEMHPRIQYSFLYASSLIHRQCPRMHAQANILSCKFSTCTDGVRMSHHSTLHTCGLITKKPPSSS